jgi:hypothetical protein
MMDVLKIQVSKDQLLAMPTSERALFILLGYAANQLSLFSKLVIFSTNRIPGDEVEGTLSGAQTQMLLRMVIGVLHETWVKIITNRLMKSPLAKDYLPRLDQQGRDALEALNKLFGGSNLLNKIRNSYSFHHPYDEDVEAAFLLAASNPGLDSEWVWYFSTSNFNSLYFVSEFVILHGILKEIGEQDLNAAQEHLMVEVRTALNEITTLIMALTSAIWRKHFGNEFRAVVCAKIPPDAPNLFEFWLPFLVKVPDGTIS